MHTLIEFFGRLHPLLLHTPLGILPAVAILELLSLRALNEPPLRTARLLLWWVFALSAVLAAATGVVLSRESEYGGQLLDRHFYLGIALAGLSVAAAALATKSSVKLRLGLLSLVGIVMIPTGHLGASLTHGEGFLTAPFRQPTPPAGVGATPLGVAEETWFSARIMPIFENACVSCHNESKAKGGLMLHSYDAMMKGATAGAVVVPSDPEGSELLHRITLPTGDEFRMPPDGKAGLTKEEIAAISDWIRAGASGIAKPPAGGPAEPPRPTPQAGSVPFVPITLSGEPATAIRKLRESGCVVERRTMNDDALVITLASTLSNAAAVELLSPLGPSITDLTWPGATPDDSLLRAIRSMPRLDRLDLRGARPHDKALSALAGHPTLATLNLSGSSIGEEGLLATLESLPSLRMVFLWGSGVKPESAAALVAARPKLVVDLGLSLGEAPVEQEDPPVLKNVAPAAK